MAVITQLNLEQAQEVCKDLNLDIVDLQGIVQGTENSTFLIKDKEQKKYILTLFEQGNLEDIKFICNLQNYLQQQGLPVLSPKTHSNGEFFTLLKNKPCLVFDFAEGSQIKQLNSSAAEQAAIYIAKQHKATANYPQTKPHLRYISYLQEKSMALKPFLSEEEQKILDEEINLYQTKLETSDLPTSVLHGDLFRDNVFFANTDTTKNTQEHKEIQLSAVIDFYNSCTGVRIYDLAVLVCDWSIDEAGNFYKEIYAKILDAYKSVIDFTQAEQDAWTYMLRLVATRYWISRLLVVHLEEESERVAKDPNHFKNILLNFRQNLV